MDDSEKLLAFDRDHLWHPYTSMTKPLPVYPVSSASGSLIKLADGRELIDGMSSWWAAVHGYRHPVLDRAAKEQLERVAHVMFGGLTHEPAVRLAEKLLDRAPAGLEYVFYADSGSVSVEVALKMALQYWKGIKVPGRTKILTVRGGYHGDTFGAMAVCDPETGMHSLFSGMLAANLFAERPSCRFDAPFDPASLSGMARIMEENAETLAAVILEPVVQGAGGMWFYHPDYLAGLRKLCDEHDLLLVVDEIATGFGRTGKYFASEWAGISPDIMCVGKALTGGYMTLAATLANGKVARGISRGGGVLMHGPTFMANPLACAVACASLDLLDTSDWPGKVRLIERLLGEGLSQCRRLPGVLDVRVLGAIGVVEMERPVDVPLLQAFFVEQGVWIRPFGRLIYLMPPYIAGEEEVGRLAGAIFKALEMGIW